ncbi:hypothetical protein FBU30_000603 [Linnemannia zychae]|nr:hypothetical protein FBU30_000603 [Linnemannia zychae]
MTVIPDYLPNLQTLHLFDAVGVQHPFVLRDAAIKFLSSCPQTLRHLSVAWTILPYDEEDIRDHNSEKTSLSIQNPHPELKFLSVRTTPDATNDNGYLSDFVATCPKLQCIINPTVDEEQIEKFINNGRSLQQALLKVTEIRFKELHVPKTQEDNSVIAEMINEIHDPLILMDTVQQCWHTISIKEIVKEHSDLILDAILKSCQGLVRLHVPQGEWISSRKIQSILCCAKDLRIFHAVRPPVLYAQDFISSKWSCRWLTVLSIQILGIPRPDIVSDRLGRERALADREAEGTMSASRALQRKVYQQLGLLTHLEFLDLGIHVSSSLGEDLIDVGGIIFDRQFQLDCLEMSLESGLDLLSSLQNLRSLRVVGMEHRIGIEELKWMLVHFLRLESLKGVNPEICYLPLYVRPTRIYKPEPEVEQWLTTQKYTWVLVE